MDRSYITDCFKRVNRALKKHGCEEHAMLEPIGEEPFFEELLDVVTVGTRISAEFKLRFPEKEGQPIWQGSVAAKVTLTFENGKIIEDTEATALEAGFVFKKGTVKRNTLGWYVEWQ